MATESLAPQRLAQAQSLARILADHIEDFREVSLEDQAIMDIRHAALTIADLIEGDHHGQ